MSHTHKNPLPLYNLIEKLIFFYKIDLLLMKPTDLLVTITQIAISCDL